MKEKLAGLGVNIDVKCGPDFERFIDTESAKWGPLVNRLGLKLDY